MYDTEHPRDRKLFLKFEPLADKNIGTLLTHPVKLKRSDPWYKVMGLAKYDIFLFKERSDSALLLRSIFFSTQYLLFVGFLLVLTVNSFSLHDSWSNILTFLKDDTFKAFTTFLGSSSIVYWNLSTKFGSQWKYCADLYNKIFIDGLGNDDKFEILYKKSTLALDLLATDMWHHKSFSKLFAYVLESALLFAYENNKNQTFGNLKIFRSPTNDAVEIRAGSVDVNTAGALISNLQNSLEKAFLENNQ